MTLKQTLILSLTFLSNANSQNNINANQTLQSITDTYRSQVNRSKDFVMKGDGTVLDKRTGLQWQQCSMGQTWENNTCTGDATEYTWSEARKLKNDLYGHSDWRLPSKPELETLILCSSGKDEGRTENAFSTCAGEYVSPTIAQSIFPETVAFFYWTSTKTGSLFNKKYWGVYFDYGYSDNGGKDNPNVVRLVRHDNETQL